MDIKSGDLIAEEKLKKITDNIDELYKNINSYNFNGSIGNTNYSNNNNINSKNQNDLFNALNPQIAPKSNFVDNSNIQNGYYNVNQNQQMIRPNQYNMSHNNQFYPNANSGYGQMYPNQAGFAGYYQNNILNNKTNFQQIKGYMNNINNRNTGLLTDNDVYLKKDDLLLNLNLGQSNNDGVHTTNANFINFNEGKHRKNEDPFSNLISFK